MPKTPTTDTLFYGDNLDILRKYIDDESGRSRLSRSAVQLEPFLFTPVQGEVGRRKSGATRSVR
jgi:hypothetical protein